jgi:hypothetical protein
MSSYASIYIGDKEVFSYRNEVHPEASYIFSEDQLVRLAGEEAVAYASGRYDLEAMHEEDLAALELAVYRAPAGVVKDRLNVLGYGEALVRDVFEEELLDEIRRKSEWVSMGPQMGLDNEFLEAQRVELEYYQSLSYKAWKDAVAEHILDKRAADESEFRSLGALCFFESIDTRVLLGAIAGAIDPEELFTLDVTDLEGAGWLEEQPAIRPLTNIDGERGLGPPIIITEGSYDAFVLRNAVALLKPHLSHLIRFLDYDVGNEGSASAAVRTLKSFASAGVANRIVALFDNDSAAHEAVMALKGYKLPPHYCVMHYPDLALAKAYPTLGPQGETVMDVNRLAGSIELYLGADVLADENGQLTPVQWKGYMGKVKSYQGEVVDKVAVQRAFNNKMKAAQRDAAAIANQDWSGIKLILDHLIETLGSL